jgi:hypothetical protein
MHHEIPAPGFQLVSGKRKPPDPGPWFIQLRMGFADTRIAYDRDQIEWIHQGHSGDVVAVKKADGG